MESHPTGRISTGFDATSTAADVIAGIELTGRRAIVTGGASGIGVETARALSGAGAEVTLAVRNLDAGQRIAADITATTGNAVQVRRLDLVDLASVAAFVAGWHGPLHLLVNNAGVMALPDLQLNSRGWELQFATNHLGHFALALGLHDALASARSARIVSLSSRGHLRSPVVFDDLFFASRDYDPFVAYGQSKTANVLFAVEATRRWANDGITANAVHPGAIAETNLARHMDRDVLATLRATNTYKSTPQGAATSTLVATTAQLDGIGGRYFEDCNEAEILGPDVVDISSRIAGVASYALDPASAQMLWDVSSRLLDQQPG